MERFDFCKVKVWRATLLHSHCSRSAARLGRYRCMTSQHVTTRSRASTRWICLRCPWTQGLLYVISHYLQTFLIFIMPTSAFSLFSLQSIKQLTLICCYCVDFAEESCSSGIQIASWWKRAAMTSYTQTIWRILPLHIRNVSAFRPTGKTAIMHRLQGRNVYLSLRHYC